MPNRGRSAPGRAPAARRPAPRGRPPGGNRRAPAAAPGAAVTTPARPPPVPELGRREAGRGGRGRREVPAVLLAEAAAGLPRAPRLRRLLSPPPRSLPRHLRKGNFPAGNFCCVNARPQEAARGRPGAPHPCRSAHPPPAPPSRTQTRPRRVCQESELREVGAGGSPRPDRPQGSLSPPEAGHRPRL